MVKSDVALQTFLKVVITAKYTSFNKKLPILKLPSDLLQNINFNVHSFIFFLYEVATFIILKKYLLEEALAL